ncbi:Glycerophosphoryl diester phosphodiesterase family protein [Spironucleus salmonicida]|uniref:Glycerophosphoryl diester phosphodiesterase family protein n=1 Tax=Spironucleus salmonicida TaxID=348837 RepID=A0A9P8M0G6_9EUKA|nr:Glycerophosphoryl diester phosphodiesterase family protein [Spironucleus salmonicida]
MPTLDDVLQNINQHCGINIEIKYPSKHCQNIGLQYFSRIEVIRIIFESIKKYQSRNIYFSSFDPYICSILAAVQNTYPVLFLHYGTTIYEKDEEINMSFIEVLDARFGLIRAQQIGVQGMVLSKEVQCWDKDFISKVKKAGLKVFTYGTEYDDIEFVKDQQQKGVDGIIFDLVNHDGNQGC